MADFSELELGSSVKVLTGRVPRIRGRTGRIISLSRSLQGSPEAVVEELEVDIAGHGTFRMSPAEVEFVS